MLVARIEQGFRAVGFARAEIGFEQRLLDDIALRPASTQTSQITRDGFEQAGRAGVFAAGGSLQRFAQGYHPVRPARAEAIHQPVQACVVADGGTGQQAAT